MPSEHPGQPPNEVVPEVDAPAEPGTEVPAPEADGEPLATEAEWFPL